MPSLKHFMSFYLNKLASEASLSSFFGLKLLVNTVHYIIKTYLKLCLPLAMLPYNVAKDILQHYSLDTPFWSPVS